MLALLYKLQKLESQETAILAAQKNCAEYKRVRELKTQFDQLKTELLQLQQQLNDLQQEVQELIKMLGEMTDKLTQERAAVYDGSIANIREFNARQAQISALEEKSSAFTTLLNQKEEEFEQGSKQAKKLKQKLKSQYQQLSIEYQQYDDLRSRWLSDLETLAKEKETLLLQIPKESITWYKGQKPLFSGLPIALLDTSHVCTGCRTMVTPALYKRTLQGEHTRCEKCGRYLFVE